MGLVLIGTLSSYTNKPQTPDDGCARGLDVGEAS